MTPDELGLEYRRSALRHGQVVASVEFRLTPRDPDEVKATVRELNARRKAAQPTNRRTFGSVFKNPDHELTAGRMLEACGLKGFRIGGAQISPEARQLHRERRRRHDRRRAGADGRGAAPGARAVRRRAAPRGAAPRRDRGAGGVGAGRRAPNEASCRPVREASPVLGRRRRPSRRSATSARLARRSLPSRRSVATGLVLALCGAAAYGAARQTTAFAVEEVVVRGAPPAVAAEVRKALAPTRDDNLLTLDGADVVRRAVAVPRVASATYDRAFPHTLVVTVRPERAVAVVRRGAEAWLVSRQGRVLRRVARGRAPAAPRVWVPRSVGLTLGARVADPVARDAIAAAAVLRPGSLPVRVRTVNAEPGMLTFTLVVGPRAAARRRVGAAAEARGRGGAAALDPVARARRAALPRPRRPLAPGRRAAERRAGEHSTRRSRLRSFPAPRRGFR